MKERLCTRDKKAGKIKSGGQYWKYEKPLEIFMIIEQWDFAEAAFKPSETAKEKE